jgi:hypothetical protein
VVWEGTKEGVEVGEGVVELLMSRVAEAEGQGVGEGGALGEGPPLAQCEGEACGEAEEVSVPGFT